MQCAVCRAQDAVVGLLCDGCRDDVAAPMGLLPQQLLATVAKPTPDVLIDQWGRAHALESRMMMGRSIESTGMMVLEASVSRHHAHLAKEPTGWRLRDLGSTNGTFLNEVQINDSVPVAHGDRIALGSVGFYLACDVGEPPPVEVDAAMITTIQSLQRIGAANEPAHATLEDIPAGVPTFVEREDTDGTLPAIDLVIAEPTGGGGGVLQVGDVSVQLSVNQADLLRLLAKRMLEESSQPAQVRGFVRSSELLASIAWDTRDPDDNHLKQLIRRARRLLIRAGLGDLIESRQRFGYRLRVVPVR